MGENVKQAGSSKQQAGEEKANLDPRLEDGLSILPFHLFSSSLFTFGIR
jgi:hypothetical protein